MRQILSIETTEALKAASAALEAGAGRGHALAVCVVDATGTPLILLRDDRARLTTVEMAINKAWTAAAHQRATHELAAVVQPGQPGFGANIQFGGRLSPLPGGLPIAVEGGVAGGIGVSGGDAETDIAAARAGLAALG
ncbi:MAG: heme-binding protein [Chelatococcus sp.]|uniref:GlcG/HbpS family heme-binding protein n=1 Tax=Chelatococcus sp. TaxID=1953771 RepID=UPI0025B882A2|nr:heme-binding protein [Chelatococcus sp.]MBX3540730.1 heme-binding protein [Chelatococcus sp.]